MLFQKEYAFFSTIITIYYCTYFKTINNNPQIFFDYSKIGIIKYITWTYFNIFYYEILIFLFLGNSLKNLIFDYFKNYQLIAFNATT